MLAPQLTALPACQLGMQSVYTTCSYMLSIMLGLEAWDGRDTPCLPGRRSTRGVQHVPQCCIACWQPPTQLGSLCRCQPQHAATALD